MVSKSHNFTGFTFLPSFSYFTMLPPKTWVTGFLDYESSGKFGTRQTTGLFYYKFCRNGQIVIAPRYISTEGAIEMIKNNYPENYGEMVFPEGTNKAYLLWNEIRYLTNDQAKTNISLNYLFNKQMFKANVFYYDDLEQTKLCTIQE